MLAGFDEALRLHQNGQVEQAAGIYRQLLARQANPDVFHLLGVAHHQTGDFDGAVRYIGRAIAMQPAQPMYHINLGEVYRAHGQYDRAVDSLRTALTLEPTSAQAANNLGLALMGQGKFDEAIAQFRQALEFEPNVGQTHNNLGNAYRANDDRASALQHFRRAVELAPSSPEARTNLGQLLLELDQPEEGLVHCQEAVRLRPRMAEAHNNLGNVLRELGELNEAKRCYNMALRLAPNIAMTFGNMGQALHEEGEFAQARAWYGEALRRDARAVRIHCHLASAWEAEENHDEARARYETALRLDARCPEAHHGLAVTLHPVGQTITAIEHLHEAIRLKPDFAAAHNTMGTILEELGKLDEARDSFREALRHSPDNAVSYGQLATMLKGKLPDEDVVAMEGLLIKYTKMPTRRIPLHYGLAQALDGRKEYPRAAEHLRDANALRLAELRNLGKHYDPAEHERFADNLMAAFTRDFLAARKGIGSDSRRPIFIVGMPRSGTTLLEQILASHSQVYGAGELRLAREGFETIPQVVGRPGNIFQALPALDQAALRRLADQHLEGLRRLDEDSPRIVDKMPDNYMHLGYLQMLFPEARFIHSRRDVRDVSVSCWMTNFKSIRWACDAEHIGRRVRTYRRLMQHWQEALPMPVLEIDYEDTVKDLEGVARRMLEWCGLDWEPDCLAFHETSRPVRTASVTQVRQPIYSRSVERWRNYEADLADLFSLLN